MQKTKQLHVDIVTDFFYTTNIIDGLAKANTGINARILKSVFMLCVDEIIDP